MQNRNAHRAPASPLQLFSYFSFIATIASGSAASSPKTCVAQAASSAVMMHKDDRCRNKSLSPLPSPKCIIFQGLITCWTHDGWPFVSLFTVGLLDSTAGSPHSILPTPLVQEGIVNAYNQRKNLSDRGAGTSAWQCVCVCVCGMALSLLLLLIKACLTQDGRQRLRHSLHTRWQPARHPLCSGLAVNGSLPRT